MRRPDERYLWFVVGGDKARRYATDKATFGHHKKTPVHIRRGGQEPVEYTVTTQPVSGECVSFWRDQMTASLRRILHRQVQPGLRRPGHHGCP